MEVPSPGPRRPAHAIARQHRSHAAASPAGRSAARVTTARCGCRPGAAAAIGARHPPRFPCRRRPAAAASARHRPAFQRRRWWPAASPAAVSGSQQQRGDAAAAAVAG
ncbi:hypothetical protein G6F40_014474 [Rhizopus arrhizus]|nr:hypothetical protein G6F24_016726 [Rhizopus arrhizus]KAG1084502.1 hypothetical protein G6F40_014474 [Rhizopus arrhizus]KAG1246899.1 hypothetical protein G6F65_020445 [Rhizopus arrhizus]